jgi:hypothetical protein
MFRGPIALRNQCSLNESAIPVARRVILPINAPTHALIPKQLHLHVEPTLFMLLSSKTMLVRVNHVAVEEAQEAPNVVIGIYFLSTKLLQLRYLILKHHILHICCICWEA